MKFSAACLVYAALSSALIAQTNQGSIAGSVLDPSGALIDGAKMTATNVATRSVYTTESSGGAYRFPALLVGKYDVTATAAGFQTVKQTGIEVLVSNTTAVNFTMSV